MRGSDTIVGVIDEAYDTLGLNDEEMAPTKKQTKIALPQPSATGAHLQPNPSLTLN